MGERANLPLRRVTAAAPASSAPQMRRMRNAAISPVAGSGVGKRALRQMPAQESEAPPSAKRTSARCQAAAEREDGCAADVFQRLQADGSP